MGFSGDLRGQLIFIGRVSRSGVSSGEPLYAAPLALVLLHSWIASTFSFLVITGEDRLENRSSNIVS